MVQIDEKILKESSRASLPIHDLPMFFSASHFRPEAENLLVKISPFVNLMAQNRIQRVVRRYGNTLSSISTKEPFILVILAGYVKVIANGKLRKFTIVGDGGCGKTSLLLQFTLGYFPSYCVPTVFESYVVEIRLDGRSAELALWDTADHEGYAEFRDRAYSESHVVLIGFSVDEPGSLHNVRQKWMLEAEEKCSSVPIILVGLKKDLRGSQSAGEGMTRSGVEYTTPRQGSEMAEQCGAREYLECSATTGEGVDEVFAAATRAALSKDDEERNHSGCCVVL